MSDKAREKGLKILKRIGKIIGIILLVALVGLIVNIIYGKIQYSKIPEVEESIFYRTEHQTKLPDDEDAFIQLQKKKQIYTLDVTTREKDILETIEPIYFLYNGKTISKINNPYKDSELGREWHQEECIIVYSGDEAYCGTWIRNKNTIDRILNTYYDDFTINGEKVTIREYLDAKEPEIKAELEDMNRILSMDYYLPNDQILSLLPSFQQGFARSSMVMLIYYIDKEDWNMVEYIIKLNYKNIDIMNHLGGGVTILMSAVIQDTIDNTINSSLKLLPEELRLNLAELYTENTREREELIHEFAKGEYVLRNEQTKEYNGYNGWASLLLKFPLFSYKDTKKLMLYGYSLLYNENSEELENLNNKIEKKLEKTLYNRYGATIYDALMPRTTGITTRIDWNLFHKQALISNLKSGEYNIRFNEKQRNDNPSNYEIHRLTTEE